MDGNHNSQKRRGGGRGRGNTAGRGRGGATGHRGRGGRGGQSYQGGREYSSHRQRGHGEQEGQRGGSRRRGQEGTQGEQRPISIGFKQLREAMEKEPEQIAMDFGSQRCLPAFHNLVGLKEMNQEMVALFLKVLAKLCECRSKEYLFEILCALNDSMFLLKHVKAYFCRMALDSSTSEQFSEVITDATTVFHTLLRKIPQSSDSLPIVDLLASVKKLKDSEFQFDSELLEKIEQLTSIQEESYAEVKKQTKLHSGSHSRIATDSSGPPPNNFREISVVPRHDDIHSDHPVYLRRNKVDGAYENLEHYLDVQFRLLREDFVMPLREGIKELVAMKDRRDAAAKRLSDIRVYYDVRVLYPECTGQGLVYRLKFDNARLQRYRWENGKRLIFGSLLCLSKDRFQTFLFATVVNRELKDLVKGIVTVKFVETAHETMAIQQDDVYEMVETTAYFEAYRHVLTALQETYQEDLPFEPYFVECRQDVLAPRYLRRPRHDDTAVTFDFSPIVRLTSSEEVQQESLLKRLVKMRIRTVDATHVPVLDTYSWPSAEDMGLDDSQLDSLKIALTKELAIIQGPPGTGKTYMGLKIAKLLLHNKDIWLKDVEEGVLEDGKLQKKTKPILVICYTNHALDQFLEGIQQFHPEGIIRIGGRSSSESLKSMNLSSVKQQMQRERRMPRHIHRGFAEMRSDLEDITRRMTLSTTALKKCRENILTEKTLKNFGLITNEQYKALTKPYRKKIIQGCVIVEWLMLTSVDLNEPGHRTEIAAETVELLENIPVTFDGRKEIGYTAPGVDFGGNDFSLVAKVMTGIGGTIVSKVRPQGDWEKNCKSLFINLDGFVTFSVGEVGMIQSRTKVNDDQDHEVALVYVAEEGRLLLYIDRDLEDNSILPLMPDNGGDVVQVGFTCESYPPGQSYLSGVISSLTYHRNSVYRDQVFGEDGGAIVQNEVATIQDQRIVDGENDEMLEEIGTRLRGVNADTFIDVVDLTKEHVVKQDSEWMVQDPKKMKKRIENTLKRELISTSVMSDEEAKCAKDLWKLSLVDRWRLYRKWTREIMTTHENAVETIQEEYEQGVRKLQEVRNQQSVEVLRDSQVIGMTTTGAAKYREVLQQVRPRITIVEEAAEVLESHIVTALTPACEHLILIGDHKQLRPNPTVYDLAKSYNLDVSLFERLVENDLPYACLRAQHRMRPEISRMMNHIYQDLEDHDSVKLFENIRGVSKNIFFIQHHVPETSVEDIKSHSNDHEAKFIISLCRYFLQQNYKASQITILTPYVGQLLAFKKYMIPANTFKGVRVCTVDNFQGEENDIILMSLVRSNDKHKIGFLSTDNRICVALSRAKKGFFCIGNIELFEAKNDLWKKIIAQMRALGNVGKTLSLSCQNHPQAKIEASRKEDFAKAPNGGCMMQCEFRLKCGHVCEQLCHPKDSAHEEYKCRKPCEKNLCEFGHKCKKVCYKDCGVCRALIKKVIPSCGHEQLIPCHLDPDEFSCLEPCEKRLACNHVCDKKCGEACANECGAPVEKDWSSCGHRCETKCHIDPTISPCNYPCREMLLCGHECSGTCSGCKQGRFHEPCQAKCGRVLFCDHNCDEPCTSSCPPCAQKCENRCIHSACKKKCSTPCPPCQEPCRWRCSHYQCTKKCGDECDRERCNEPCRKLIKKCKHPCIGLCGEPCPKKCRICDKNEVTEIMFGTEDEDDARFVELSDCSHVFEVTGMDRFMDLEWEKRVKGDISNIKMVKCPKCCVVIRTSLRYGNIIKNVLMDFEMIKMKVVQLDGEAKLKVQDTLEEVQELRKIFPKEAKNISKVLRSDYVSSNALNLVQNQTRFLKFLVKLKEIVEQLRKDIDKYPRTKVDTSVTANELDAEIGVLKDWVCKPRQRFGDQVLVDCNEELLRSFLLFTHKALETQLANREVDLDETDRKALKRVENVLEKGGKLDPVRRERYMKFLEDISERHCDDVSYVPISETEKKMIVKAMDLKQGHWFKCPKGHIYCIDQCGGATEEGTCPECGNLIGGTSHRLRDDNQLAGEMDGARHAAWSQTANNMANFDMQ